MVGSASEIKGRLKVIEEHGGAPQIVILSQEANLDPKNRWREFSDGTLKKPVTWLVLGNGDGESERFRKRSRHLQGHTTFMQKPFTNYQLYYALDTVMQQDDNYVSTAHIDDEDYDGALAALDRLESEHGAHPLVTTERTRRRLAGKQK